MIRSGSNKLVSDPWQQKQRSKPAAVISTSSDIFIIKIGSLVQHVWDEGAKEERNLTVAKWAFAEITYVLRPKSNYAWGLIFGTRSKFQGYQNLLSGYWDVVDQIYLFVQLWPLAYTTACAIIQAMISDLTSTPTRIQYKHILKCHILHKNMVYKIPRGVKGFPSWLTNYQ